MVTRVAILSGLAAVLAAGTFAVAQHLTTPPGPNPPAADSTVAPADAPAVSPVPAPSTGPVVAGPSAQPAVPAPVVTAPPAAAPGSTPAPVVTAPTPATPPPAPVVTAPPVTTSAPVVTTPATPAPASVVTAPPIPRAAPKPAVSATTQENSTAAVVDPPLPLKRPVISKMTIPAKSLFAKQDLPSLGKAMAIGYYPRGCLQGGVELPINGPTWQVMRVSRNRNWGHPALIRFLERFAPLASKATGWHGILVGDLAQPRGGPLPYGHTSHQIGLDVDIWFMPMPDRRLTQKERDSISANNLVADDWKHVNPKVWTPAHAAFIRTAAEQPEVERVLVNAAIKKKMCEMEGKKKPSWMKKVRPWYAHHDHIHVRLECPSDSPNCRSQPPVPNDDGCDKKDLSYWFSDRVLHPKPKKGGGKPKKALTLADLPPACTNVLDAPAKKVNLSSDGR